MARAIWNGVVLAESNKTIEVEGSRYFPPESIRREFFRVSDTRTTCRWKGVASYYSVKVGSKLNIDGAWFYPAPSEAASALGIKDWVAFWKGIKVEA